MDSPPESFLPAGGLSPARLGGEDDFVAVFQEAPELPEVVSFDPGEARTERQLTAEELNRVREEREAVHREREQLEALEARRSAFEERHGRLLEEFQRGLRENERWAGSSRREVENLRLALENLTLLKERLERVVVETVPRERLSRELDRADLVLTELEADLAEELEQLRRKSMFRAAKRGGTGPRRMGMWNRLQHGVAFMLPLVAFLAMAAILVLTALGYL